ARCASPSCRARTATRPKALSTRSYIVLVTRSGRGRWPFWGTGVDGNRARCDPDCRYLAGHGVMARPPPGSAGGIPGGGREKRLGTSPGLALVPELADPLALSRIGEPAEPGGQIVLHMLGFVGGRDHAGDGGLGEYV